MPRILISTQVFPPEIHPTSVMVRELATHLSQNGWDVEVVCGYPHHPTGVLPEGRGARRSCVPLSRQVG
ncbi:MAG: hypothetical protein M0R80_21680 [Proteobacteria bacterium]|jgi:hypothetical protein|nr:hypothetical protein [Pseudomonadota bacterium]